jgi:hypothetical protein
MREHVTTALEVAGMAAVTAGAAMIWLPVGLIVGGLFLLAVGVFGGSL